MGAILRVYKEKNNGLSPKPVKISNFLKHWVAGRYTIEAKRATVNASVLNVRTGPRTISKNYQRKDEEVFVFEEINQ